MDEQRIELEDELYQKLLCRQQSRLNAYNICLIEKSRAELLYSSNKRNKERTATPNNKRSHKAIVNLQNVNTYKEITVNQKILIQKNKIYSNKQHQVEVNKQLQKRK